MKSRMRVFSGYLLLAICTSCLAPDPDSIYRAALETHQHDRDIDRARAQARAGAEAACSDPSKPDCWRFRLLEAHFLILEDSWDEAWEILRKPLPESPDFVSLRARRHLYLAKWRFRRTDDANEGRSEALENAAAEAEHAHRWASDARAFGLLAEIEILQGRMVEDRDRPKAEALFRSAAQNARLAGDAFQEMRALNGLGLVLKEMERFDEAVSALERCQLLAAKVSPRAVPVLQLNLGIYYTLLGHFERGEQALEEARAEFEAKPGSRRDRVNLQAVLGETGNNYYFQGDSKVAGRHYLEALRLAAELKSEDQALWAGNLARAFIELEKWETAERLNEEAIRLKKRFGKNTELQELNAAEIALGRLRLDDAERRFKTLIGREKGSLLWNAHFGLARVAQRRQQHPRARHHFEEAIRLIETSQDGLQRHDSKFGFLNRLIGFYRTYVVALVEQGRWREAFQIAESSRGRVLAERARLAFPERRVSLGDFEKLARDHDTAFLSYFVGSDFSFLWVISPRGTRFLRLPPPHEIRDLVDSYRRFVVEEQGDPLGGDAAAGIELYEVLLAPARDQLKGVKTVIVAADGPLHGLNLETLPVYDSRPHYWIEEVTLTVTPSLNLLLAAEPSSVPAVSEDSPSILLIGDPVLADSEFPALPFAKKEISDIRQKASTWNPRVIAGPEATPESFLDAHPENYSFIHFATHAEANSMSPLDSSVILTRSPRTGGIKLYARDIVDLELRSRLVTISSCSSAGTAAYSGEGLIGFAWAFLKAGSDHVVAGLWDVDDRSTAQIMSALYGGLAAGQEPSIALRNAKLEMIAAGGVFSRPFFWGPFQVYMRRIGPEPQSSLPH